MSDSPELSPKGALPGGLDPAEVAACLRVLRRLVQRPDLCDCGERSLNQVRQDAARLLAACKQARGRDMRQRDRDLLDAVEIRSPLAAPRLFPVTPAVVCQG